MDAIERLVWLYYIAACGTMLVSMAFMHAIMLRTWNHWWADVKVLFQSELRLMMREVLQPLVDQVKKGE